MDPKQELATLVAKNTAIIAGVKAGNRALSEAEAAEMEKDSARIVELKGLISRGEAAADRTAPFSEPVYDGDFNDEAGVLTKGYLTPEALKRTIRAGGADGAKALVAPGSSATQVVLDQRPVALGKPGANLGLLNVLPVVKRTSPKYSYLRQTVRTNNAAVVEPGAQKPTSVFTLVSVDNELDVVAHESEYIDKYTLRDNENLQQFVQNELGDGIFQKVTALGVAAFAGASGATVQAFQGNAMDSIYLGAAKASDLGYSPDVLLISRADYDAILLAKDTAGNYLYRNAEDSRLNGLHPVIVTGLPAKTALVLDSSRVGISTDKIGMIYEWDTLTRKALNEANVLVEGRFSFDIFAPASIVKVGTAA
ncbi:phage major capsid protein [uncultured Microbacterium sp.]|uniref:phage major capsid protein n=1 Tax=uncultured Microbacterium sp. TaxID=191216 RepID=UPI0025F1DAA7|nr:phage major capsid protein [uncultured Microbacterium sp.]